MMSQPGKKQLQYTYCPKSQEVKTVKFGHLIEYNMRTIVQDKSYPKCGGKTSPKPFSKKPKFSISLYQ